eukprot:TRINITY_DN3491_c0_g1_i1.p1 TRINITY_DN3491_c0_g1~~TRINITY_DN3491_c0_g1_i1.p1  ORF type:complete len:393 (-),score=64.59 TRINITY_DN3491_c0_g1_i1:6-1184(-)
MALAGTLSGDQASLLLSFIDHYLEGAQASSTGWSLYNANIIELGFLLNAGPRIVTALNAIGLTAQVNNENLVLLADGVFAPESQLQAVLKQLEEWTNAPSIFDYVEQHETMVKRAPSIFEACAPSSLQPQVKQAFEEVKVLPLLVSGESFLVLYEVGWASAKGVIEYPNANLFSEEHNKAVVGFGYSDTEARTKRNYRLWSWLNPLHESFHILQSAIDLREQGGWRLEHDATRCQMLLLGSAQQLAGDQLPVGLVHEVALYQWDVLRRSVQRLSPEAAEQIAKGFERWRNSFGRVGPSDADSFAFFADNPLETVYVKTRLGLEAYLAAIEAAPFNPDFVAFLRKLIHACCDTPIPTPEDAPQSPHVHIPSLALSLPPAELGIWLPKIKAAFL